jgi:hypothetical protein
MAVNLSRGHLKTKKNTVLIFFLILFGGQDSVKKIPAGSSYDDLGTNHHDQRTCIHVVMV